MLGHCLGAEKCMKVRNLSMLICMLETIGNILKSIWNELEIEVEVETVKSLILLGSAGKSRKVLFVKFRQWVVSTKCEYFNNNKWIANGRKGNKVNFLIRLINYCWIERKWKNTILIKLIFLICSNQNYKLKDITITKYRIYFAWLIWLNL